MIIYCESLPKSTYFRNTVDFIFNVLLLAIFKYSVNGL